MNIKIKIYILLTIIVLSQSIPVKNVSKNNKPLPSSAEEESVSSTDKVESSEFEENENLNRTKKSPSICIHLYDDARNCGCGSIETNVCDHTDQNYCNCNKDVNSQSTSDVISPSTSSSPPPPPTTTTTTAPEEIKIQTEKSHIIGPLFIKDNCLVCGGKKKESNDEEDNDQCNCPNNLIYNTQEPPKVIEYDKNLYKELEKENIDDFCDKMTTTTTKPTKPIKNKNKKKIFTTTEKPKIDQDRLNKLFKEFHMTNERLNNYLEEQKLQNLNKNSSTIKPIVKQGRTRSYKSARNKEISSCNDENHHHHKTTSRPSGRRISVRSATETTILTTKKNDNNNSENIGTMKNINLSTTELLNIMKKIENSSSTKTQV